MEPVYSAQQIMDILPHRFPFVLIDRVVEKFDKNDPKSRLGSKAVAIKNVSLNEQFFVGHFPGRPIMPGVLIIEAMAQTGCMAFYRPGDTDIEVAIASLRDARFRRPVVPGDQLRMTAEVIKDRGQMVVLQCQALVDSQLVAEAEVLASIIFKKKAN